MRSLPRGRSALPRWWRCCVNEQGDVCCYSHGSTYLMTSLLLVLYPNHPGHEGGDATVWPLTGMRALPAGRHPACALASRTDESRWGVGARVEAPYALERAARSRRAQLSRAPSASGTREAGRAPVRVTDLGLMVRLLACARALVQRAGRKWVWRRIPRWGRPHPFSRPLHPLFN